MILENYELNLPGYSVGDNVYESIGKICEPYGAKVLVIGGRKGMAAAKEKLLQAIEKTNLKFLDFLEFGNDCTYDNVNRLQEMEIFKEADMVFAVGGGKALDTCKCLCTTNEKPIFTFPTIASNCAACTTVSIMYNNDGTFLKPHFFVKPAAHAFIDTQIIAQAPYRYMWAGIGDTYAKYYEATISSRDEQLQHFTALGVSFSRMCLDPLVVYAAKALEDNKTARNSYELEQTVLTIIVTTAIVSIFLTRDFTPDYNSGLAHAIFYALTKYPIIEQKHLHGEVVGFGVLFALLCDNQEEEFQKIYSLNQTLSLPVTLNQIDITEEEFLETINRIPEMSDVRHYPYKITKDMLKAALQRLQELEVCKKAD